MSFQMTDSQQTVLHVTAVDKKGNPTNVSPGSVAWLIDNPNVATLTPSVDGLSATLVAVGPIGTFIVTVNATVGGTAVSGTLAGSVVSGAPTQVSISADTPTEQP